MRKGKLAKKISIVAGIIIVLVVGSMYTWKYLKERIADTQIQRVLSNNTDGLYSISYDNLYFDEAAGDARIMNVRILPDTGQVGAISSDALPPVLLDVAMGAVTIRGVKSAGSLKKKNFEGDTIIIHHPRVTMYVLKPLDKNTRIEKEAQRVYGEIMGKIHSVKVKYVMIDSIYVNSVNFRTGKKDFDFINGNIQLSNVLVDSTLNEDSSRVLFSRQAAFRADSFYSYNNNRPELVLKQMSFHGAHRTFSFGKVILNRFDDASGAGRIMLDASDLKFSGINTFAIVNNKNLLVDSIRCRQIKAYVPTLEKLPEINLLEGDEEVADSTHGFQNAYTISLNYLSFDNMEFIHGRNSNFDIGKTKFQLHNVSATRFSLLRKNPLHYIGEANLEIEYLKMASKDRQYLFGLNGIKINSLRKTFTIRSAFAKPILGEDAYANHYPFQRDRFNLSMKAITLDGIEMEDLFNNKLIASQLTIKNTSLHIYRDLNKPLEQVSKVGNYPSQMLEQLGLQVSIDKIAIPSAYIEYKEKQIHSGRVGVISFAGTTMKISNVTNIKNNLSKNPVLKAEFDSKVLGTIPLSGNFAFFLGKKDGSFEVNGSIGGFDALTLNKISIPMAMIKIRTGHIDGIDFNIRGDDYKASGPLTMKYHDIKFDVLKKREDSDTLRRRGLLSLLANMVVSNSNPSDGKLKTAEPEHKRNIYKSLFNLVWKTLLKGMKESLAPE